MAMGSAFARTGFGDWRMVPAMRLRVMLPVGGARSEGKTYVPSRHDGSTGGVAAAPLAAGATVVVPVAGMGQVPTFGVTDVYAVINAINPTASGALEDYNSYLDNPGIWTVPFV